MNFTKLLRTPILKNICERLLLVAGCRTTYKLNRRDLLLLPCLVYINASVASSFTSFIYNFFVNICFGFEIKLANGKLHEGLTASSKIKPQRTRLNFQAAPAGMIMWNLQIKILYILGHTDNDKDRLQHPEQQI